MYIWLFDEKLAFYGKNAIHIYLIHRLNNEWRVIYKCYLFYFYAFQSVYIRTWLCDKKLASYANKAIYILIQTLNNKFE